jgi:hypothetical protein
VKVFERTRTVGVGANAGSSVFGMGVSTGVLATDGAGAEVIAGVGTSDAVATAVLLGNAVCGPALHAAVAIASVAARRRTRMVGTYKS